MDEVQSNDYYYNARAHFSFFEPLYKDFEAMSVLRQALSFNPLQVRDKVVLDIGSGPGVFALMAARAGARKVYAWEPSAQAQYLVENIKENGFEDTIEVVTEAIEEISVENVDVVFTSDFGFGFFLNSLFSQFRYAVNHYLRDGGVILPGRYRFWLSTFSPPTLGSVPFWKDVYGFDYTPIEQDHMKQPFLASIAVSRIKTDDAMLCERDFKMDGFDKYSFTLNVLKSGDVCGFLFWWEAVYDVPNRPTVLSTSPRGNDTHWSQVCVPFGEWRSLEQGDVIKGEIRIIPSEDARSVAFDITYHLNDDSPQLLHSIFK